MTANWREFRFIFESDPRKPQLERDQIRALAEGFVRANEMAISHNPQAFSPRIEDMALRYIEAPSCKTKWPCQPVLGIGPLVSVGEETCFGLTCLHASLLRYFHNDKRAIVEIDPRYGRYGLLPGKWHAVVITGRGRVLDTQRIVEELERKPSMVAGYRPPPRRHT